MNSFAPDDVDFAAYEWQTECKAKLRRALSFADDVAQALLPPERDNSPTVFSFKLRHKMRFRVGEVSAWAGYSGHRKSMMTGQVALELARQGQRTLVISLEMAPAATLARMARQFCGVGMPQDLGGFFEGTKALWVFDHVGRLTPHQTMAVCRYFAEEHGGQHVFIDSFMMVCGSEERMDEQKQFTTDLVRMAQETGLHVHLIAHCRKPASGDEDKAPGKHDLRGTAAITDQCHNVLTVWANKGKQRKMAENPADMLTMREPDAELAICKQRNGDFEGRFKLWFDPQSLRFLDEQGEEVVPW